MRRTNPFQHTAGDVRLLHVEIEIRRELIAGAGGRIRSLRRPERSIHERSIGMETGTRAGRRDASRIAPDQYSTRATTGVQYVKARR